MTHADLPASLLAAYQATCYRLHPPGGPAVTVRVGPATLALDAALSTAGVTSWAFVTADNPGPRRLSRAVNARRATALVRAVRRRGLSTWPAVVLGEIPHGLVAIPLAEARRRVELEVALGGVRTWGEARALLTADEQEALAEAFEESADDEPFAVGEVWGIDDGEWPGWPPRTAVDDGWFPASVVALGTVHETTHSGPYLAFDPGDADRVAEAFRAQGYEVTFNDTLVDAACGGYNGTTAQEAIDNA